MTTAWYYIDPLDVLMLRGNKLFGDPGSHGDSMMPPWPSGVAGAMRSALLAHKGVDLEQFARGEITDPELGTPTRPGTFGVTAFGVARRYTDRCSGRENSVEPLFPLPADLVAKKGEYPDGDGQGANKIVVSRMRPGSLESSPGTDVGIDCSAPRLRLPSLAILAEQKRNKPETGRWLTSIAWRAHLEGKAVDSGELVEKASLWDIETRVGIGLDAARRHASDGQLFTTQAVAFRRAEHGASTDLAASGGDLQFDVGFFVGITGAEVPEELALRFGGDGRAALARKASVDMPQPDYRRIVEQRRCRIILTSPGIFEKGWLPTGMADDGDFALGGVAGKLHCAAVPRHGVISGFDLAARKPKPALRVAPTGSTYWIDDLRATPEALGKLATRGLWSDGTENDQRRAEGFNLFTFAAWRID